jgi:hypothetical protein
MQSSATDKPGTTLQHSSPASLQAASAYTPVGCSRRKSRWLLAGAARKHGKCTHVEEAGNLRGSHAPHTVTLGRYDAQACSHGLVQGPLVAGVVGTRVVEVLKVTCAAAAANVMLPAGCVSMLRQVIGAQLVNITRMAI